MTVMIMLRKWLEVSILGVIAAITSVLWLFIEIAESVAEGETAKIDTAILMFFRSPEDPSQPIGPWWLSETMRDISGLGSPGVLSLIIVATVIFIFLSEKPKLAIFVLVATFGGGLVSVLLKEGFSRPRPNLVPYGTFIYGTSFPSGHAMMSALVYLTLGGLIAGQQAPHGLSGAGWLHTFSILEMEQSDEGADVWTAVQIRR
jgi:undecaprenyl-diphosphatase